MTNREENKHMQERVMQAALHNIMEYSIEIEKDGKKYLAWSEENRQQWRKVMNKKYKRIMNVGRKVAAVRIEAIEKQYGLVLI